MPVRDFGLENLAKSYKSIVADTSCLLFNVDCGMTWEERGEFDRVKKDRAKWKELEMPLKILKRTMDFNSALALFFETYPSFRMLPKVREEYGGTEFGYARKIAAPLIKSRRVGEYNATVEELKKCMDTRLVPEEDDLLVRTQQFIAEHPELFSEKLSPVDREIATYPIFSAETEDSALLVSDKRAAKTFFELRDRIRPKNKCDIYTTIDSEEFREFVQAVQ